MFFGVLVAGALVMLFFFMKSFKQLVDLATTLSFVTAPVLAYFNHQSMFSSDVPDHLHPRMPMRVFSLACQVLLVGFAIFYLWHHFHDGIVDLWHQFQYYLNT